MPRKPTVSSAATARKAAQPSASGKQPIKKVSPLSTTLPTMLNDGSDDEFRELMYNFWMASASMLKAREKFAEYVGVTAPQYSIIAAIGEIGPSPVGHIASRLRVSSTFATAEINKLARIGFVAKERNELDGRSTVVTLTGSGSALIEAVSPIRRTANDIIFGTLTATEARAVKTIVRKLVSSFEECLHELESSRWSKPAA